MKKLIGVTVFIIMITGTVCTQDPEYNHVTVNGYFEQDGIQITKIEIRNDSLFITADGTIYGSKIPTK